jgi:hypothetical protein
MNPLIRSSIILLLLLVLLGIAGCGGGSAMGTVNGTVTFDGQPLKQGTVRFVPVDGKSPTASANVTDGKFTVNVPTGEMRVEFSAPKATGRRTKMYDTPDSPVVEDTVELIPERYNVRSELKISVKKGSQDETFTLKLK